MVCLVSRIPRRERMATEICPCMRTSVPDGKQRKCVFAILSVALVCSLFSSSSPLHAMWMCLSMVVRLGRVFEGCIGTGAYHPAVSLYMGARLKLNPGTPNTSTDVRLTSTCRYIRGCLRTLFRQRLSYLTCSKAS